MTEQICLEGMILQDEVHLGTHGKDRITNIWKETYYRTKHVREWYYRTRHVREPYYRTKHVREQYYRMKHVREQYYRTKYVRKYSITSQQHEQWFYAYRGQRTLGGPYHRAEFHTTNLTWVTIGLHSYIIDLSTDGKGNWTRLDTMKTLYTLLWMDYPLSLVTQPYNDYIQATTQMTVTGRIQEELRHLFWALQSRTLMKNFMIHWNMSVRGWYQGW